MPYSGGAGEIPPQFRMGRDGGACHDWNSSGPPPPLREGRDEVLLYGPITRKGCVRVSRVCEGRVIIYMVDVDTHRDGHGAPQT